MNIKAIIFDVDGVLLQAPRFFSQELQDRGYKNAAKIMNEYYENENNLCAEGKVKAIESISPYLEKIGWNEGAEEYFRQQFCFEGQYLETSLVSLVPKLQELGIVCYLGTDQEENRAKFLLEGLDFENIVDGYFISCYVGSRKCFPKFWNYVKDTLGEQGIQKEEIVFFDDLQNNIDVAQREGIRAFLFTNTEQFEKDLGTLGIYTL